MDYENKTVYEAYEKVWTEINQEKEQFVKKHMHHVFEGIDVLEQILNYLK